MKIRSYVSQGNAYERIFAIPKRHGYTEAQYFSGLSNPDAPPVNSEYSDPLLWAMAIRTPSKEQMIVQSSDSPISESYTPFDLKKDPEAFEQWKAKYPVRFGPWRSIDAIFRQFVLEDELVPSMQKNPKRRGQKLPDMPNMTWSQIMTRIPEAKESGLDRWREMYPELGASGCALEAGK